MSKKDVFSCSKEKYEKMESNVLNINCMDFSVHRIFVGLALREIMSLGYPCKNAYIEKFQRSLDVTFT